MLEDREDSNIKYHIVFLKYLTFTIIGLLVYVVQFLA